MKKEVDDQTAEIIAAGEKETKKQMPKIKQVNEMFKQKSGLERMSDVAARDIQALLVLAEAINRAKSTEPQAVVKALSETNLTQDQILMPWKGVKFDSTGENVLASFVMQQIIKGQYEIVWPDNMATAKPVSSCV